MKHPECLNRETLFELRTLLAHYPYFQLARLLYLKNLFLLHDISFGEELRKAALFITDRSLLFQLVEGERYSLKSLEVAEEVSEEKPGLDRTLSLIDAFLSTLPEAQETELSLPMTPVSDYTEYLLKDENSEQEESASPKLKGQGLIDSFLEKSAEEPLIALPDPEESKEEPSLEEEEVNSLDDESYFTETLAKIYVKQQRYLKALEIIKRLNLKYPKKNAYFADQIRFLEKLIINTKSK